MKFEKGVGKMNWRKQTWGKSTRAMMVTIMLKPDLTSLTCLFIPSSTTAKFAIISTFEKNVDIFKH